MKITVNEFSIFLKSKWLLLAIFLKFIFGQKKTCGLILPKTFACFISKTFEYLSEKRVVY